MWKILTPLVLIAAGAGTAWVMAGRAPGPVIDITEPDVVGQTGRLALSVEAPGGDLTTLEVVLEQDGSTTPLFNLADGGGRLVEADENRVRLTLPLGREQHPDLSQGEASVSVRAVRPVLFGYREAESEASHGFEVDLQPPRISVASAFHYINHGGAELIVYRVTPSDAVSGVRVGDEEYRGFPATGAGIETNDSALKVAFFALEWDQPVDVPIQMFARDTHGNEAVATFDHRVFEKDFRESRINLSESFLRSVVPSILQNTPEFDVADPTDLIDSYLAINSELRERNNAAIAAMANETAPEILWRGPFKQLVNTAVEAGFADQRTYMYNGEPVDEAVHLGYDLASTAAAPVLAANRGRVLHAGWLGIYGNTVVVDHGMGLQSLYAHLSSIDVEPGDMVEIDGRLGRSGSTGLAGGDHLHFTMLLGGNAITPVDWWSDQWVSDRILRKLREAGAPEGALRR